MTFCADLRSIAARPEAWVAPALILGFSVDKAYFTQGLDAIIPVALFLMLYPGMLDIDIEGLGSLTNRVRVIIVALALNYLLSPPLMAAILHFLGHDGDPRVIVGLTLYSVAPCGGMVPAFTAMASGNVHLAVALTAISFVLSLGIVPVWTGILIGAYVEAPIWVVFRYLFVIIVLPLLCATATRHVVIRLKGEGSFRSFSKHVKTLSNLGLFLILFAMTVQYGDLVRNEPGLLMKIAISVTLFIAILFCLSRLAGRLLRFEYEDTVALSLATITKNNALAMALAFSVFGPETALANAIAGPLVQLPALLVLVTLMRNRSAAKA